MKAWVRCKTEDSHGAVKDVDKYVLQCQRHRLSKIPVIGQLRRCHKLFLYMTVRRIENVFL
jgi:hypothetical protein